MVLFDYLFSLKVLVPNAFLNKNVYRITALKLMGDKEIQNNTSQGNYGVFAISALPFVATLNILHFPKYEVSC